MKLNNYIGMKAIVATGGCYYPMHEAHYSFLSKLNSIWPKHFYHRLLFLNSNEYIEEKKKRKVKLTEQERIAQALKTGFIDEAIIFEEDYPPLHKIQPFVRFWVKGFDYVLQERFPELIYDFNRNHTRLVILDSGSDLHSSDLE